MDNTVVPDIDSIPPNDTQYVTRRRPERGAGTTDYWMNVSSTLVFSSSIVVLYADLDFFIFGSLRIPVLRGNCRQFRPVTVSCRSQGISSAVFQLRCYERFVYGQIRSVTIVRYRTYEQIYCWNPIQMLGGEVSAVAVIQVAGPQGNFSGTRTGRSCNVGRKHGIPSRLYFCHRIPSFRPSYYLLTSLSRASTLLSSVCWQKTLFRWHCCSSLTSCRTCLSLALV